MSDGKQETQVQHPWLWVIIPYGTHNKPLLSAYCKNCQATWTESLDEPSWIAGRGNVGSLGKSQIPIWGCKIPPGF